MIEDINKFFLYDRWFYLKKETTNKRTYATMVDDSKNGLILILDKKTNEVEIISLKDSEFIAKLYISDITQKQINFHYKENTPQNIYIEDDLYVNLLLEAFVETNYGKIDKESLIRISKKKNLDKILYCTPPLPLDKDIYLDKYKIKSDMLEYFLGLIDSFSIYLKKLNQVHEEKKEEVIEPKKSLVTNLEIPETIYIYDRDYSFVRRDYNAINYINKEDGENNLRIKLDPNFLTITGINIEILTDKNQKYDFTAFYTENNKVLSTFESDSKVNLQINYTDNLHSHISFEALYDEKAKAIDTTIKLEKNNTLLSLTPHPIFSNVYVDENGNEYHIGSQDFSRLYGMANYSVYILNNISKTLVKNK